MTREAKSARRVKIWKQWSALHFCGLLALWPLINFGPETFWLVTLLAIAPPFIFLLPALTLAVLALRGKQLKILILQIPALLFWLVAFSGFHVPLRHASNSSRTISAMTFNIRSGSLGVDKVIAIIATQKPDILFLQEAELHGAYSDPIPALQKALKNYHVARYQELAIFSRLPVLQKQYHALPHHQIGILEARLDVDGKPLTILCAHFSNPLNGGLRNWLADLPIMARFRGAQADALIQIAGRASTPVVVGGDFNLPPRGALYRKLAAHFSDAFASCGLGFGNTFPAFFPVQRIDYVWTKNGAQATACGVLSARASDHRALTAQIVLP